MTDPRKLAQEARALADWIDFTFSNSYGSSKFETDSWKKMTATVRVLADALDAALDERDALRDGKVQADYFDAEDLRKTAARLRAENERLREAWESLKMNAEHDIKTSPRLSGAVGPYLSMAVAALKENHGK